MDDDTLDAKQLREQARALAKARRAQGREQLRAAKVQARSEAAVARAARRAAMQAAKQDARAARSRAQVARRDGIVEAPRAPKQPIADRLRRPRSSSGATPRASRRRRMLSVVAVVLGVVGMSCSTVLAVGALLAALRADDNSFYDALSSVCDALVGPLADVVTLSGTDAALKESLVAWGAGSIGYLVVGLVAQTLLRSAAED